MKKPVRKKKKVLVALSGGIDSAVSAYLLIKKGYQVEAAFMKNWSDTKGLKLQECPWLKDRQDALRVAAFLKIKLHTLDFEKQYQKNVMGYFFKEYKAGRTPNPDVMCNKEIKFKLLYNWAIRKGFDYLATGHYAQIAYSVQRTASRKPSTLHAKRYTLKRSIDEFKDQTYFIYNIKLAQLPHLLFPIGGMKKSQVRLMAKKIGLPNADRKESMGLCFVGKVRLKEFLEQKLKPKKGKVVLVSSDKNRSKHQTRLDLSRPSGTLSKPGEGRNVVIGQHPGLQFFTVGQRQGIRVGGSGGPYFVAGKDLGTNKLFVTNDPKDPKLFVKEVQLHSVNWLNSKVNSTQYLVLRGR